MSQEKGGSEYFLEGKVVWSQVCSAHKAAEERPVSISTVSQRAKVRCLEGSVPTEPREVAHEEITSPQGCSAV